MARDIEVRCPCCGASLTIDPALGAVVHSSAKRHRIDQDALNHANRVLETEASHRDQLFRKSLEDQKSKSELLDRKFEEALKKGRDAPAKPPIRDIDLD